MILQKKTKESFRDPSGHVLEIDDKIFRVISSKSNLLSLLLHSSTVSSKIDKGKLIPYHVVSQSDEEIVLKHPKVWFPSYPYEWSYGMLHEAAELTNNLSTVLLSEGLGLKDATPYNVLFQGTKPIFVDLASIEKREDGDAIWRPFAQFLRMFLLPLLMNREFGLGFPEVFLCYTDGLTPKYCSAFGKWWKKNIFFLVFFPKFLSRFTKSSIYQKKLLHNVELAQFILNKRFKANAKILKRLSPARMSSHWASYMSNLSHYSEESFCKKERFIKKILKEKQPEKVLDVGCNTGHFSKLAAKMKSQVVAIDYDPAVIENLYQEAKKENLDILPLVVNLTRPSPSLGWRNRETWSFLDRAKQKFDLILMLAVIHHMIVTERIPMEEIAELVAKITKKWVVIEFVEASDPKFIELQRGRDFYKNITFEYFQKCFEKHFTFEEISSADYHPTRRLVLLQKKAPGC